MTYDKTKIKLDKACPDCNGTNLTIGYSGNEGGIFNATTFMGLEAFQRASDIVRVICKDCGLIIKQYAKNPEKLK